MNAKRYGLILALPAAACVVWLSAAAAAPGAGGANAKGPGRIPPNQGAVLIDKEGLRPNSSRQFAVYEGKRCVATGAVGQPKAVAPGTYDVRVGFPSGWVSRSLKVAGGQVTRVQTGLFRFGEVTPPSLRSTVPQRLYHGWQYLTTGYQGMTARLYPGTYTVRYHLPGDAAPARSLRNWHIIGPFRSNFAKDRRLESVYPPQEHPEVDVRKGITDRGKAHAWKRLAGAGLELDLRNGRKEQGVVYLAAEIDSPRQREVELTFVFRGGMKAWLNGKPLTSTTPAKRIATVRTETFPTLRKGRNVLLVKTYVMNYTWWPFTAQMVDWRKYSVTVSPGAPPAGGPPPPGGAKPPAPVAGIRGIVFCQAYDQPNGVSGIHPEQFRIVRRPRKGRICTLIPPTPGGKLTDLTSRHFVMAMHPDLSYDATRIVFSARKTNSDKDHWNIYEMNVDGSGLRRITRDMGDCIDPNYLPSGRIIFTSNKPGFRDEYDRDLALLLHTCEPDGSDVDQITFNLSSDLAPIVLKDGRVLFTSWQHHGDHQGTPGNFALCTVMPDGTGFNLFAGNAGVLSKTKSYAQQLTDGRVVFIESAGHRHYNTGILSAVHPRKPLTTRQVLSPGVVMNGVNMGGRYTSPYPLPDGGVLVSYTPGRSTLAFRTDPGEEPHLGIYAFDFQSGRPGRIIFDDPGAQDYDPIAIYPRPAPPVIPRIVTRGKKTGRMFCVNPRLSDRPADNKRVVVGELPPAAPEQVRGVRVVEGFGVLDKDPRKHRRFVVDILQASFGSSSNGGNNFEQKRIVGYAPVEKDGSFNIEVPADTVLSLQTVDAMGLAIETQLTWTWVRPGETRFCIGCHEDREMALPNLDCMAMSRPPRFVAAPEEKRRTVDFRRDIMPVIEKRCSRPPCHGVQTKAGGLDLRKGFELVFHRNSRSGRKVNGAFFNHAYESFLQANSARIGKLVRPNSARHSPLIWRIYGRKLGRDDYRYPYKGKLTRMPPDRPLTDAEKTLFVEWVDLGAQWDNIPGEDDLPGYDSVQSDRLAKEAEKRLTGVIAGGREAFQVRCFECHDARKMAPMRNMPPDKVPAMVRRMVAKRPAWFHDSEIPPIVKHIQDYCLKPAPGGKPPAKKPPAKKPPAKKPPAKKPAPR